MKERSAAFFDAAQTLAVDVLTAEVVTALQCENIAVVLLKGPSIARWLYPEGGRAYGDTHLLVRAKDFSTAERVLRSLGFVGAKDGFHPMELGASEGKPFVRRTEGNGCRPQAVDLHRNLTFCPATDDELWATLAADADSLLVGGVAVPVLGRPSLALHVVVHAVQHRFGHHTDEDLRRAIDVFSFEEWVEAARRAVRLRIADLLGSGLRRHPAGAAIADRLLLPNVAVDDPRFRWEHDEVPQGAHSLGLMRESATLAERLTRLRLAVFPSAARVRFVYGIPDATGFALGAAYLRRWRDVVRRIPTATGFVVRRGSR